MPEGKFRWNIGKKFLSGKVLCSFPARNSQPRGLGSSCSQSHAGVWLVAIPLGWAWIPSRSSGPHSCGSCPQCSCPCPCPFPGISSGGLGCSSGQGSEPAQPSAAEHSRSAHAPRFPLGWDCRIPASPKIFQVVGKRSCAGIWRWLRYLGFFNVEKLNFYLHSLYLWEY